MSPAVKVLQKISRYFKFSCLKRFLLILVGIGLTKINGQTITIVPNAPTMLQYTGMPHIYQNKLTFKCINDTTYSQMGVYDGNSISLIPNPMVTDYYREISYSGNPIAFGDKIYSRYTAINGTSTSHQLVESNGSVAIPVTNGRVFLGASTIYKDKLYFNLQLTGSNVQLAYYDGATIHPIPNPTVAGVVGGIFIIYNDKLYFSYLKLTGASKAQLASYDETSFQLFDNPDAGNYISAQPIIFHDKLYFSYNNASNISQLAQCDGSTVSLIPNPDVTGNYWGGPINFKDSLFFQYRNSANVGHLAKLENNQIKILPNPDNGAGYFTSGKAAFTATPIIFNHKLYISYIPASAGGAVNVHLASYTDSGLHVFPNLDAGTGYISSPIVYNNRLYFDYSGQNHGPHLAVFDGASIKTIPDLNSPASLTLSPGFIIYNFKLFFNSENRLAYLNEGEPAQYITAADGDWNEPNSWMGGTVPPANAQVIVRHNINVTDNTICYSLTVEKLAGRLNVIPDATLSITH